jgi:hypothetical protein
LVHVQQGDRKEIISLSVRVDPTAWDVRTEHVLPRGVPRRERPLAPAPAARDDPAMPIRLAPAGLGLLCLLVGAALAAAQDLLTPERLVALARVGEVALSPDGQHLLYTVRRTV